MSNFAFGIKLGEHPGATYIRQERYARRPHPHRQPIATTLATPRLWAFLRLGAE